MFPESENNPPLILQPFVRLPVPFNVPADLATPEFPVGAGHDSVQRATVPEAAIDEYGDLPGNERYVRFARHGGVGTVAQAGRPQSPAQSQFWAGIAASNS